MSFIVPRVYFGEDSLDLIEQLPQKKVFIITDKGIVDVGLLEVLTTKLEEEEKEFASFTEVLPDPEEGIVMKALEQCNSFNPDLIIGLGGGSSIDTAKAVWFLYEHPEMNIDDFNPFEQLHMGIKAKYLAIPTTAGTGAETTWASIITRVGDAGPYKLELAHRDATPTMAVVDPVFTKGLPKSLTAFTGMDALGHSLEGIVSDWRNDMSDACCAYAMELIFEWLPKAYGDGSDIKAREKMGVAATLAGMGFGNSQVILGHAVAHAMGAVYHKPHGMLVGLMQPYNLEYLLNDSEDDMAVKILAKCAKRLGISEWSSDDKDASKALVQAVKDLMKKINFPMSLKDCGVTKEEFDATIDRVVELTQESPSVTMSPRDIMDAECKKLIEYVYEGKAIDF